jgi:hypothetical protein
MTGALPDPVDETRRVLEAAEAAGVDLRAIGGIGVALRAPSIRLFRATRTYHDIDLVGRAPGAPIEAVLIALGYEPARRFNALNGADRMLFHDASGRRVDLFLDQLRMCHDLRFAERLTVDHATLPLADLMLSKLQIVELNDRDAQDVAALLADHELTEDDSGISMLRMRAVCATDWGWWRTVDENLRGLIGRWPKDASDGSPDEKLALGTAMARAAALREGLASAPRSAAWRLRAVIGDRVRWYAQPEEVR